jgi:hypothetical protein
MLTTISRPISIPHESTGSLWSLVNRFLNWCADQQENRLGWQGTGLIVLVCILMPLTALIVFLSGANPLLILTALVATEITLVTNLSAMPTKITIPAFILGVVMDIAIMVASVFTRI